MKKVVIIGSGGAGKSTFARRLHEITNLPLIHLDKIFWKPNWTETPKEVWRETIESLVKKEEWIMDGNFGGTMNIRFQACDTIIYFDMPRLLCIYRAFKRISSYYNQTRPDMGAGCQEHFDLKFFVWIWNFQKTTKPRIEENLRLFASDKNIIRLTSRKEVEKFFEKLASVKVKSI